MSKNIDLESAAVLAMRFAEIAREKGWDVGVREEAQFILALKDVTARQA
ncbi:hypothetical protein HF576_16400 [Microbacterium sp. CFH 90308]|uniref:Uncharacterized protein n=1 Tax=Microbacterium salsuginis TaxID=2722803 RepID=A0ABX1KEU7_9MICO|nr:hypothetical protein [Microbacterium sp. CFH 90308]NLP85429.1 hypothetical protein [Microbacterium sp. CFH 90308]